MFSTEPPSSAIRVFNTQSIDRDTRLFPLTLRKTSDSSMLLENGAGKSTDYFYSLYQNAKKTIQEKEEQVEISNELSSIPSLSPKLVKKETTTNLSRSTSLSSTETGSSSHRSLSPPKSDSPLVAMNIIGSATPRPSSPPELSSINLDDYSESRLSGDPKFLDFIRSTSTLSARSSPRIEQPTPPDSPRSAQIFSFNPHSPSRLAVLDSPQHHTTEPSQRLSRFDSLHRPITSTFHSKQESTNVDSLHRPQECLTGNCKYLFPSERCHVCRPDEFLYQRAFYSSEFLLRQKEKWRRPRTVYTEKQLVSLEKAYKKNKYLRGEERKALCKTLSLEERHIKVWYQNRRAKERGQIRHDKWLQRSKRHQLLMAQQQKQKLKQKEKQEKVNANQETEADLTQQDK
ncbi:homeobox protein Nkx-6.1-like [Clytia hemisphaerica]|uniref:Homeobox domain-containing protein n=1 Tax=Clytia hemisphaerica TaxID=252671 RepID=A0A7M5TR07_9CNID